MVSENLTKKLQLEVKVLKKKIKDALEMGQFNGFKTQRERLQDVLKILRTK